MADTIPDILFSRLSEFVAAKMGLYFPKERWPDLERGMKSVAREFGFSGVEACIQRFSSLPLERSQIEILASHLTVGETYFFREKNTFAALEEHIFPDLIRSREHGRRSLRIWSAGCATGEEPYSIAILLRKLIPDLNDWNVTILGTDINPAFLQKASRGVYSEWSFRDTPRWVKEQYFKRHGDDRYEIRPEVRTMVTFSYLNLAEDKYPSLLNNTNGMDLILCRNVLMYFAPETARRAVHKLRCALVDEGWLIVSPSEASHVLFSQFATINLREAILYRKAEVRDQRAGFNKDSEVTTRGPAATNRAPEVESWPTTLPSVLDPPSANIETPVDRQSENLPPDLYLEAVTFHNEGRYTEAAEKLSLLLSDNETHGQAMALLARIYANQGKLAEALQWCVKAVAGDKLNPAFHFLEGMIHQERGAPEDAISSIKRSLYLDQNFALAHFALGGLTLRQGRVVESNKHFKNALALMSAHPAEEILPESDGLTAGRLREIIGTKDRDRGPGTGRRPIPDP